MPTQAMKTSRTDLLQGTLDLLILKTLSLEPMHGWDISKRIQSVSKDTLQVKQGSLYPCLHRLQAKGLIESEWGIADSNRRAKFYSLTATGLAQLEHETSVWEEFTQAVSLIMKMA